MQKETIGNHVLYCGDCQEILPSLADKSINHILTDPPYKYLKNISWDTEDSFNEDIVFDNFIRLLKAKGFVLLFGRGTSFYRWNCKLADRGLKFKEEVIWDKKQIASPTLPLFRIHETISIYTKDKGAIKQNYIPYMEMSHNWQAIQKDLHILAGAMYKPKNLEILKEYVDRGKRIYSAQDKKSRFETTIRKGTLKDSPRELRGFFAIDGGYKERDIIRVASQHQNAIHPTQKPVRLIERLILITSASEGDIILDAFMGSGATGVACERLNRRFIGIEREQAYFDIACKRIEAETKQAKLNLKTAV